MKLDSLKAVLAQIDRCKQAMERGIRAHHARQLTRLPSRVGLPDIDSLILALMPHASTTLRNRLCSGGGTEGAHDAPNGASGGRTRSSPFSSEVREKIEAELRAGNKSVMELSREYGPSRRTIMNWKRELGITQPRRKPPDQAE